MRFLAKSGRMVEICCAVECEWETEGEEKCDDAERW